MNEKSTIVVTLDLFHLNYVKGFFSYDCARWFCTVMSECFVVFFQIFVAHLERNIRFWWFLRTFWSLGIRLVERYFCFLFSGRFFKFFGRISILCFCATISTYQQIISQNNRKKWQIAKKSLKRNFRQVHRIHNVFKVLIINLNQSEVQWIKAVKGTLLWWWSTVV